MDIAQGVASLALGYVLIGLSARRFSNFLEVPCFYVFTLFPFQGVDILFLSHIPRVPLRLPWAYGVRHVLTWILALRAVFNVNVRQLAVNERQCFLCGLWCAMSVNGFSTA